MRLYFGGAEVPSHRKLLAEEGIEHVALSYFGLRRRTKFSRPWIIAEKFPDTQSIFLDSGAYTVNSADEEKYSVGELKDISAHYMSFVMDNIDRLTMVSEFDALALGEDWIEAMREDFYDDLPADRFMPIWHPEIGGLDSLDRLAQRYERVGIPQTALDGRNLDNTLNNLVQQYGVKLHGIAMTKPDVMSDIRFDSVASTSWLSPSQYGDTIVWTGKELKRYPKKYKEDARKRHRTLFEQNGFDAEAIENDDTREILRLSLWSWSQQVEFLTNRVTTSPKTPTGEITQVGGGVVDTSTGEMHNSPVDVEALRNRPRTLLPVLSNLTTTETVVNEDGTSEEVTEPLVAIRSSSMRQCSSCFLAKKCPAFVEGANCAYDIPVVVKTKTQMAALQNSLIEMQTQRVLFAKMAEDMEGGYPDKNLSSEIDRLQKLVKTKAELEEDSFTLKVEAKERGKAGMISRLFGNDAGEAARALPAPVSADSVMQIFDAEIVEN